MAKDVTKKDESSTEVNLEQAKLELIRVMS